MSVPGKPTLLVSSTAISLSWSMPSGSVVERYELVWQKVTSRECPDEDIGSDIITDGRTSYNIVGLQGGSSYSIAMTRETGERSTNSI